MKRWTLLLLMSASAWMFLFEDVLFGLEKSPLFPRLAAQQRAQAASAPLEDAWQALRRARQDRYQRPQVLEALAEAETLAAQVEDAPQQGLLLRTIAAKYARLGELDQAIAAASQINYETRPPGGGFVSLRAEADQAITQAYLEAGQLDAALQFAQGLTDARSKEQGVEQVAKTFAEQGRLDQAIAIAAQIEADTGENVRLQEVIARGYGTLGQYQEGLKFTQAIANLSNRVSAQQILITAALRNGQLAEAEGIAKQIEVVDDQSELRYLWTNGLREVALAYSRVGQIEQATAALTLAYSPQDVPEEASQWAWDLAKVGDYERAIIKANAIENDYWQAETRMRIAQAYVESGHYQAALNMARQVADHTLQPLAEYEDQKVELLYQLVEQAARVHPGQSANRPTNHSVVIEAAQAYSEKDVQVKALLRASRQYRITTQVQAATDTVQRAFEIAKTIDRIFVQPDRHTFYEISNAGLLIEIAEEAIALEQTDLALMALEAAAHSARIFEATPLENSRRWQAQDLNRVARLFLDLDQPERAVVAATAALTLVDGGEPAKTIDILAEAGEMLWLTGERDRASAIFGQTQGLIQANDGSWHELIKAYVNTGQADLAKAAIEEALQSLQTLEAHQRDRGMRQLASLAAGLESPEVALEIVERMNTPQEQIRVLSEILVDYVDTHRHDQSADLRRQVLSVADTIWDDNQRDETLSIALYDRYQFYQKEPWSPDFIMPVSQAIQAPELRADRWSELVWVYLSRGNTQAANQSLGIALDSISEIPSVFDRSDRTWTLFEQLILNRQLDLAAQVADAFVSPSHQAEALRQLAHQYHQLGHTSAASSHLDWAQQVAIEIKDGAHRQSVIDAIAQQREGF